LDLRTASFRGATFRQGARFEGTRFHEVAHFEGVVFERSVSFKGAHFRCPAVFEQPADEANVEGGREETSFKGWADFRDVTFWTHAAFGGARFERRARFVGTLFHAGAVFDGAVFERARTFGPLSVTGTLSLDRAIFEAPVRLFISADTVSCVGTQFLARTTMSLRNADITLEDAEFAQPSVVEGQLGAAQLPDATEEVIARGRAAKPSLVSLQGANVGNLLLADIDLRRCIFVGAHRLDGLRLDGGIDLVPSRRWHTSRRTVYEEHQLPAGGERRQQAAVRTARTYRALRKGREDNKDEPGAADFYYGEMEMRRKARRRRGQDRSVAGTSWWEWVILTLYWLVSGYGLRAWRALASLAVTAVVFAWGLEAWGFDPAPGFGKSLLYSAESTTSLFRPPSVPKGSTLTDAGHVLQIGLRLLGPLFFGLALLALRGRVKR
jgi:uncharacterized protein YjbI with pentapeptide repeats